MERTGDTFRVTWDIGSQTYVGTGIGSDKGLAVAYRSGNQTGIAIYAPKGDDWDGVWTYTGGRTIGGEAWTRAMTGRAKVRAAGILDLGGGGP